MGAATPGRPGRAAAASLWAAVLVAGAGVPASADALPDGRTGDGEPSGKGDGKAAGEAGSDNDEDAGKRRLLRDALLRHIREADAHADELPAPEFPSGAEWFNAPPLGFDRELAGKVVVLDFWTYCCINCIHVLPDLERLERKWAGHPVAVVGVHSAKFENEKLSGNIRRAVLRYGIEHPVVNDREMALWRRLGIRAWPSFAVVGPRGNVLLIASGEGQFELLDTAIEVALEFYPPGAFRHDPVPVALEREKATRDSPLSFPGKLAVDRDGGRVFIADSGHHRVVITGAEGGCRDVVGSGRMGLRDGAFEDAAFHRLQGLAYDDGVLWVADAENHALRRVDLEERVVRTVAGDGTQGRDREGGRAGRAQPLSNPWDVAVHGGRVYVAMAGLHQIWVHDPASGRSEVFSGTGSEQNLNASDRRRAAWAQPSGLSVGEGTLFVADSESSSIRAVDLTRLLGSDARAEALRSGEPLVDGPTRAIAGGDDEAPRDLFAFGDRDGTGDEARLQHPLGVLWLAGKRRVVVADTYNHRLKLLDPESRAVRSWTGTGEPGLDDGPPDAARFSEPSGLALAPGGDAVLVADTNNHAVRSVDLATGAVRTLELRDVPPPLAPVAPRSRRLADLPGTPVVRVEPLRVAAGAEGVVRLRVTPPAGHHLQEGAPSRYQVLAAAGSPLACEESSASGPLPPGGREVRIPFRAGEAGTEGTVRIEALAWFCAEAGDVCKVGGVRFELPVRVVAAGGEASPEPELRHVLGDLSDSITAGGLGDRRATGGDAAPPGGPEGPEPETEGKGPDTESGPQEREDGGPREPPRGGRSSRETDGPDGAPEEEAGEASPGGGGRD